MKINLTIESNYLPSWGLREGIRELVQNARDAEVEHHAPMKVTFDKNVLHIVNEGTTLPHSALLLGHTSKALRHDTIGKFGEGLKLGVLALIRAGHAVTIRSGSEVWTPSLEHSALFNATILTFNILTGRKEKDRVAIEIAGITKESWTEFRKMFLFLESIPEEEQVRTRNGTLLLSAEKKGKVFVKGIFIQSNSDLQYGYDLRDAEVDRDRKMIETYNLQSATQEVQMEALNIQESLFEEFAQSLSRRTTENNNLAYSAHTVPDKARQYVHAKFMKEHGIDAVPVSNLAEAAQLEHLGVKGVITSDIHRAVLRKEMGDFSEIQRKLEQECTKEYTLTDLDATERKNFDDARDLLNRVGELRLEDLHIVDFRSDQIEGQHKSGQIYIAKKCLQDLPRTVATLIHEMAHNNGGDGTKSHVGTMENLWTEVLRIFCPSSRYENRNI